VYNSAFIINRIKIDFIIASTNTTSSIVDIQLVKCIKFFFNVISVRCVEVVRWAAALCCARRACSGSRGVASAVFTTLVTRETLF